MTCGIYVLFYDTDDFQYYIGKSFNIESRYKDHCRKLFTNKHKNKLLTEGYLNGKYPSIEIIEELPVDNNILYSREIYWIKEFNSFNNGMNETPGGGGVTLYGENNPSSKYSNDKILEVFFVLVNYPNMFFKEIASKTNTSIGLVKQISIGASHSWIKEIHPHEYDILMSKLGTRGKRNSAKDRGIIYPPIQDPEGIIHRVENTREFCREHGLNQGSLWAVLNKKANSHKGWKLYEGDSS